MQWFFGKKSFQALNSSSSFSTLVSQTAADKMPSGLEKENFSSSSESSLDNLSFRRRSFESWTSTDSIKSTLTILPDSDLRKNIEEHGRGYHRYEDGKYLLPCDKAEHDRLDLQHQIFLMTTEGRLGLAPIVGNAKMVLELGFGTGIWCMDYGDTWSPHKVIGLDLAPHEPACVPPCCEFELANFDDPSQWPPKKFNYIHGRGMIGTISNTLRFFNTCFEHTEPGGWLEIQDVGYPFSEDDTLHAGTSIHQWADLLKYQLGVLGRNIEPEQYKNDMMQAGYVEVTEVRYIWPGNTWPEDPKLKKLGQCNFWNMQLGLEGFSLRLLHGLGWNPSEINNLLQKVKTEMQDTKIHCSWPVVFVYGRKPETQD